MTAKFLLMHSRDGFIVQKSIWTVSMLPFLLFPGLKANVQNAPLISGGVGLLTTTNGVVTYLQPVISPELWQVS